MVQRPSLKRQRELKEFGANVRRWRKVNGMSATELAQRALVTRETLRNIEEGTGAPRLDSVMSVLAVLGVTRPLIDAIDPYNNPVARSRLDKMLESAD